MFIIILALFSNMTSGQVVKENKSMNAFDEPKWLEEKTVIIQGLDKVTARVFTTEIKVDHPVRFGTLIIYVRTVKRASPEEQPEIACFLEIFDEKPGEIRKLAFSGWMFASNHAINPLDHGVYDIWIKG